MDVSGMRERQINIRLSEEEAASAEAVAKYHGLNVASLFRFLVKKEFRQIEDDVLVRGSSEDFERAYKEHRRRAKEKQGAAEPEKSGWRKDEYFLRDGAGKLLERLSRSEMKR
jgi:hypothetical protein